MKKIINKLHQSGIMGQIFHTLDYCLKNELSDCESVLDLGCGPSSPLQYCNNIKYSVGIEAFGPYLEATQKKRIHTEYVYRKIEEVDFPENKFDAVIILEVLEHLPKETGYAILKNAEKWARKKIVVSSPNGYISQKQVDGNYLQKHLSGWDYLEMKGLGFKIRGLAGLKILRQEVQSDTMGDDLMTSIKFKPRFFWFIIATFSQVFTYFLPKYAFELFSVKKLNIVKENNIKEYYDEVYKKQIFVVEFVMSDFFCSIISRDLIQSLIKINNAKVLDIGCSNADLLCLMKRISSNNHYYGIDISNNLIEKNKIKFKELEFLSCDLLKTNFESNFFDIITTTMVIEHVDHEKLMVNEIFRILKQDGRLYITTVLKGKFAIFYLKNDNNETVLEISHKREYKDKQDFINLFKDRFTLIDCEIRQIYFPLFDFFARRIKIINTFNKKFIKILRKIKIPIIGYYSIECIFVK